MTFQNPRLHTTPAERMRARCLLASRFVSSDCVADNGGTINGAVAISNGATIQDGQSVVYQCLPFRDDSVASIFVKFSAVDEGAATNLFNFGGTKMVIVFTDGTVTAYHTDGVTISDSLEIEYDYLDGEDHSAMYSVDVGSGVHTLFVGTESATGTTTVSGAIVDTSITFYGIEEHTVYKGLAFNDYLDSEDFEVLSDEQWIDFMKENLFAVWRCNSFKNDTIGHFVRDKNGDKKITKGDGSTSSTFPILGGDNGDQFYEFGANGYLTNFPTLPDDYTISISASNTTYDGRFPGVTQADNDDSLFDNMGTAGGFAYDNIHNMVVSNRALYAIEKAHLEYQQKHDDWRSSSTGIIHSLITEGVCRVALLFNCPTIYRNIADDTPRYGSGTGMYSDGAAYFVNFLNSGSNISLAHTADDTDMRAITIVAFGNLSAGTGTRGMVAKGSDIEFRLSTNTITLNTSSLTITEGARMYAVSAVTGEKPRFFKDELYVGDGDLDVTIADNNTTAWTFGNITALTNEFSGVDAKAFLVFDAALTDNEIIALYHALENSFAYEHPATVSTVWNDTITGTEIKNDTIASTNIKHDRVT